MYKEFFNMIKKNHPNQTIVIDAVVGAGKTVYMNMLSEALEMESFEEPVVDNPILDKFYYDRKRFSFPLQIFFLNRRFKMIKSASQKQKPTIMDRSIYGDMIFAKMLHDEGNMDKDEFNLYQELLTNMLDHVDPPKLMVYLEIDTDSAIERIKKRGRDYEQVVERAYWENLNREYRSYFNAYNLSPLLIINASEYDIVENKEDQDKVLEIIKNKLKEIDSK